MDREDLDHASWRGLVGVGVGYGLLLFGILVVLFLLPYLLSVAL